MIPYILAAVGGYLIGDSLKGKQYAEGGMTEKGGGEIKDQYENMSPKQVWEKWNSNQREHFVSDHYQQWNGSWSEDMKSLPKLSFEKVVKKVPHFESALIRHISMGQYAEGGMMDIAAVGGYLIGDSLKGKRFAEGGMMDDEQIYFMVRPAFVNELMDKAKKENVELEFIETDEDGNEVYFGIVNFDKLKEFKKLPIQYKYSEGGVMKDGNVEFKPYGKTKGNYKLEYKVDGEHQSEIWESKEMVEDAAKRYSKIGYTDIKITEPKMMAKGGMVVTSIKDIPNFKQRLKEGKITYRGLGMGKLAKDFYDLAGTNGTRIKVDGKEYFITVEEFDTFSRDANGKMRIRFDAPYRKFEEGGMMANGGRIKVGTFSEEQLKNKEDKKAVEKAQKESGLTYVDTKIIKKGGKMYLDVYLIPNEEYYNSSKFAKGGGVESYSELRKVPKKVAGELTLYKLGDKWSPNFDYTGMLETALKADVSWGMSKLRKLYDSLEDVNYHTASRSLWEALKSLKDYDIKAAEKHLENFRSDVMEELK